MLGWSNSSVSSGIDIEETMMNFSICWSVILYGLLFITGARTALNSVRYSPRLDFSSGRSTRQAANGTLFSCTSNDLKSVISGRSSLSDYAQPMDTMSGKYDTMTNNTRMCLRKCDGKPRLCYYQFNLVPYRTLSPACGNCPQVKSDCYLPQCVTADGVARGITTINRMLPGPAIQVCEGDTVVVDLINSLPSGSTTIHWHGIRQMGSQYYDGVPYVTQCPILPDTTFRYQFKADTSGSFFYHSHLGFQKLDGASGPLIVRENPNVKRNYQYDEDLPSHILYIQDWMHILAEDKFPYTREPNSYLVNGRGIYVPPGDDLSAIRAQVGADNQPPVTTFNVTKGKTYRFRLISGTCIVCPVVFYIQGHNFTVVAGDGGIQLVPRNASKISLNSGERFDIVMKATNDINAYWIVLEGSGVECAHAKQVAILRYNGAPAIPAANTQLSAPGPVFVNPVNSFCNASMPNDVCLSDLRSSNPPKEPPPNGKMTLQFQFGYHYFTMEELFQSGTYEPYFIVPKVLTDLSQGYNWIRGMVNNQSFEFPPSPLISQYNDIPKDMFCKSYCPGNCTCANVVRIPLNYEVTIIVSDFSDYDFNGPSHPFHLHGYNFNVLEMGVYNTSISEGMREVRRRVDSGLVNNPRAAMKDSISVPSGGYIIIRFIANNPGFWLLHCHFLYHLDTGMEVVLWVGEFSDLPPVPKGFPKCNNYIPKAECYD